MAGLSAKTLVMGLLSASREGALPVRVMNKGAEIFGISSNSLRVALTRLVAKGALTTIGRGEYGLSEAARRRNLRVVSWRDAEKMLRPWSGHWVAVVAARPGPALATLGYQPLRPALWLRPDNLVGGVAEARQRLMDFGLGSGAVVGQLSELADAEAGEAAVLWDPVQLADEHRALRLRLQQTSALLRQLPVEEAARTTFTLGGEAIRQIILDPHLPRELDDGEERRSLVKCMFAFDREGRAVWRRILEVDTTLFAPMDGLLESKI